MMGRDILKKDLELLLSTISEKRDQWGLDLFEESEQVNVNRIIDEYEFTAQGMIEYLEENVLPFLEDFDCQDERRALKKGLVQLKATINKNHLNG